jgi:FkbH-like protein
MKSDGETSESEFLQELQIEVNTRFMSLQDVDRVEQLFQRTNQFTAVARRRRVEDLKAFMTNQELSVIVSRARDRFGDLGLISVAVLSVSGNDVEITDWAMSCRSFGRGIEDAILADISSVARKVGATMLHVKPISTGRNRLFLEFIKSREFSSDESGLVFTRILGTHLDRPSHIAGSWPEKINSIL